MQFRRLKLRFRRQLRQQQRQVEDISQQAEKGIERHLLRRFERLRPVRRFIISWILLFVLLIGCLIWQMQGLSDYYQSLQPIPGGIYSEGLQGSLTNANPIYATSDVDNSVAHLVFAGLMTFNASNQLVGNLASDYSVDATGTVYTVHLKPHLTWQDGQPLTSADVLFTYHTIQNPDAQSPLSSSWQGITLAAPDAATVTFTLPSPLASFPYALTTGLIPAHILSGVRAADLRSASFNTQTPVGAGPFIWHSVEVSGSDPTNAQEQVALTPFAGFAGGKPKLDEFILRAYADRGQLTHAFQTGQLTAAQLNSVPVNDSYSKTVQVHSLLLTAGTYVFFKTTSGVLSDPKVRQALVLASNPGQIISNLGYASRPVREPLLEGQLAYNPAYAQQTNNLASAEALLTSDGWSRLGDGVFTKNGQPLTFGLVATDTPEYRKVTSELQRQWQALGVKVQVSLETADDYSTTLQGHQYDATLYGVSIGVDPDVFVYWDSSQADIRSANRLNLSEYSNPVADGALEAGRTRLDPALRVIKYAPFLQSWQQDAPALGLYQPRVLYLTHGTVYGLPSHAINNPIDRFDNVQNWQVRTANVTNK